MVQAFETPIALGAWLREHHARETELWVRMYKKGTGVPSVTWDDCVIVALAWGWIDGQRKSLDAQSFLQRLSPRRARSSWSKRNCEHAERLIQDGAMQPAGLAQVEAARADGRWERAYAGSADMVIPEAFLSALKDSPEAEKFYRTLNRQNLFVIYHRIQTAKREETRAKRIAEMIAQLARGEALH
ncbi:MAG: YdeI/OmpD-associated family protein [Deltaproteobacteria bacterium]|nr:YdeI/OmpD-associated family protein [Deltaproteobacteria bacterium]